MFKVNWGKLKHFLLNAFSFYQNGKKGMVHSVLETILSRAGPLKKECLQPLPLQQLLPLPLGQKNVLAALVFSTVTTAIQNWQRLALLPIFIKDRYCLLSKLAVQVTVAALTIKDPAYNYLE